MSLSAAAKRRLREYKKKEDDQQRADAGSLYPQPAPSRPGSSSWSIEGEMKTRHDHDSLQRIDKAYGKKKGSDSMLYQTGAAGSFVFPARATSLRSTTPGYGRKFLVPLVTGDDEASSHVAVSLLGLWQVARMMIPPTFVDQNTGIAEPSLVFTNHVAIFLAAMGSGAGLSLDTMRQIAGKMGGEFEIYPLSQAACGRITQMMTSGGLTASIALSLFRPSEQKTFERQQIDAQNVRFPTGNRDAGRFLILRMPLPVQEALGESMNLIFSRRILPQHVAQILQTSLLQAVKPVNATSHNTHHQKRERAACRKLQIGQWGVSDAFPNSYESTLAVSDP